MPEQKPSTGTRYGQRSGSGANEPKGHEKKEQRGWVSRQGGDQTREPDRPQDETPTPESRGNRTRGATETATMPHLEGANQGPK